MELNKLQNALVELYHQLDFIYQLIEDGRIIAAYRQTQGSKAKVQSIITKLKEEQDAVAQQNNKEEPKNGPNC